MRGWLVVQLRARVRRGDMLREVLLPVPRVGVLRALDFRSPAVFEAFGQQLSVPRRRPLNGNEIQERLFGRIACASQISNLVGIIVTLRDK